MSKNMMALVPKLNAYHLRVLFYSLQEKAYKDYPDKKDLDDFRLKLLFMSKSKVRAQLLRGVWDYPENIKAHNELLRMLDE